MPVLFLVFSGFFLLFLSFLLFSCLFGIFGGTFAELGGILCFGFGVTLREGDVIISSTIFGIGSSREQAVSSLLAAGVRAVIAPSFGRIFFRNAWNLGLIAIESANVAAAEGDSIVIDLEAGEIGGPMRPTHFAPPPARMLEMVNEGGLLPLVAKRLATEANHKLGGRQQ